MQQKKERAKTSRSPGHSVLAPRDRMKVTKHRAQPTTQFAPKKERIIITYSAAAPDMVYVPLGTPDLADRCKELSKASGLKWKIVNAKPLSQVVKDPQKISFHIQRIGYHFAAHLVELACKELEYVILDKVYVNKRDLEQEQHNATVAQAMKNIGYKPQPLPESLEKVSAVITELFPLIPDHERSRVIEHAFNPDSDRIGSQKEQTLPRRVQLGVIANIRHNYTDYDTLLKAFGYKVAREQVEPDSLKKIIEWRGELKDGAEYAVEDDNAYDTADDLDYETDKLDAVSKAKRESTSTDSDDAPRSAARCTAPIDEPVYLSRAYGTTEQILERIQKEQMQGTLPKEVRAKNGTLWQKVSVTAQEARRHEESRSTTHHVASHRSPGTLAAAGRVADVYRQPGEAQVVPSIEQQNRTNGDGYDPQRPQIDYPQGLVLGLEQTIDQDAYNTRRQPSNGIWAQPLLPQPPRDHHPSSSTSRLTQDPRYAATPSFAHYSQPPSSNAVTSYTAYYGQPPVIASIPQQYASHYRQPPAIGITTQQYTAHYGQPATHSATTHAPSYEQHARQPMQSQPQHYANEHLAQAQQYTNVYGGQAPPQTHDSYYKQALDTRIQSTQYSSYGRQPQAGPPSTDPYHRGHDWYSRRTA